MNKYFKWGLKAVGLYFLVVVAYFGFALLSLRYDNVAALERKWNPSTFAFWQGGTLYQVPPLFAAEIEDTRSQLSFREIESLADVDIWVLLLDGFWEIVNVEFAAQLGIDTDSVKADGDSSTIEMKGVSLKLRLHPLPFYVKRKSVLILDVAFLTENYEPRCLDEMVYLQMIGQRDQALWDRCKLN